MQTMEEKTKAWCNETGFTGKTHSTTSKQLMQLAKKGRLNPKYQGCYYIVGKKFYSLREASNSTGLAPMTILRRCKAAKDNDFKFVPDPERKL